MKITLPVQSKEIKDGKLIKIEGKKEFNLDMSLNAQIRFETNFPSLAEREDIFGYSKRIFEITEQSVGLFISKLKLIYCWFDTEISFTEFNGMFDLTDAKYVEKLTKALNDVFEIIADSSAEKN